MKKNSLNSLFATLLTVTLTTACSNEDGTVPNFSYARDVLSPAASVTAGRPRDYGPLWVDLNGDDALDLVFMNHGLTPSFYVNEMRKTLHDSGAVAGIKTANWQYPQQADRHGGSCGDFDNDGDSDLFISHGAKRGDTLEIKFDELLRNDGELRFRDITKESGALNQKGRGRLGSWMDYDNDGWLDLYVGNFASDNVMYRNNGDGTFSDVTESTGLDIEGPRNAWADYDLDGHVDVLVAWPLTLMRNLGDGGFADVSRSSGLRPGLVRGSYTLAWGDFDNDGDVDPFIGSLKSKGRLMVNDGGTFRAFEVEHDWGFQADTTGNGATWGDIDNDGDLDLFISRSNRILLFENLEARDFRQHVMDLSDPVSIEHGGDIALGDYDGDGYLDLAVDTLGQHVLLHNEGDESSWLKIKFNGRQSNRMGFGTKVWATADQEDTAQLEIYREYTGDSGVFRSMGCGPMHLGLGTAKRVDLRVRWLSGVEHMIKNVDVNQTITITEPG